MSGLVVSGLPWMGYKRDQHQGSFTTGTVQCGDGSTQGPRWAIGHPGGASHIVRQSACHARVASARKPKRPTAEAEIPPPANPPPLLHGRETGQARRKTLPRVSCHNFSPGAVADVTKQCLPATLPMNHLCPPAPLPMASFSPPVSHSIHRR